MPIVIAKPVIPVVWDVSSASFDGFITFGAIATLEAAFWPPNGDNFFILDANAGASFHRTFRHPISTPYDVTTVSATDQNKFLEPTVIRGDDAPDGLTFSPDGLHMYVSDKENPPQLHTWTLSSAYNLTTAVSGTLHILRGFGSGTMADLYMRPDGSQLAELNTTTNTLNMWSLTTPFIPAGGTSFSNSYAFGFFVYAFDINSTGTQLVTIRPNAGFNAYDVLLYDIPTPWDLSSIVGIASTFDTGTISENTIRSVNISEDGSKLHVTGGQNKRCNQWSL